MKRAFRLLLCLFLLSALTVSVCAASSVPSAVIKAVDSVVRIEAEFDDGWASGSGFVIESSRDTTLIATNYHVVEGNPQSISVWLGEDESIRAEIVLESEAKDLCVLKLAYPVSLKALSFDEAELGEAIYAVGFPAAADDLSDKAAHASSDATLTDGIVSAVRSVTITEGGSPVSILQINAAINSGNSGGPLFNEKGRVVGINTYGITDAQGIFGAIAASELEGLLAESGIRLGGGLDWLKPVGIGLAALLALAGLIALLRKCRPLPAKKLAAGALAVLLLLAVGGYFGAYLMARSAAAEGDFEKADSLLFLQPLTALHDSNLVDYVAAGEALSAGDYEGAKAGFAALSGYMDADTMVLEADYRRAEALLDAGEYDEAAKVFASLAELEYSDALNKSIDAEYQKGIYLLNNGDYVRAGAVFALLMNRLEFVDDEQYQEAAFQYAMALVGQNKWVMAYKELMEIDNYPKTVEIMPAFKEDMYNAGASFYEKYREQRDSSDLSNAYAIFEALADYKESEKYLVLLCARRESVDSYVEELMEIFYFEDAAEILSRADGFLDGAWRSKDGYYFTFESEEERVATNIPECEGIKYKVTFLIRLLTKKVNNRIDLTALTPDCIEIFCYQNGRTYTLYRQ